MRTARRHWVFHPLPSLSIGLVPVGDACDVVSGVDWALSQQDRNR